MKKIKQLIVRKTPASVRNKIIQIKDLWRTFPDIATINHHRFKVVPHKFWITFNKGLWEPHIRQFYKKHVLPEKEVIDIGGWHGASLFVAYSYQPKKITVAEADPQNFEILKKNCDLNHFQDRVELHNICISDVTGEKVRFGPMDERLPHSAINGIGGNGSEIDTISLRDFLKERDLKNTNIIKIDIEGGERLLKDGLDYISGFPGIHIFLAMHPPFWPDKQKTADMFIDKLKKFEVYTDTEQPLSMDELNKRMLSEKKTHYAGKRGIFFDIILKTREG
ncbi:MAG: FkbM family methyltransferase [Balneolaceae bacterium]|nr:FkbM family methyltransferase [Balneolaceae bacterium]